MTDYFDECKQQKKKCAVSQQIVANILKTLLNCLAYMKEKKICHRDLKTENIMHNPDNGDVKIIDFELAKMQRYKHEKLTMLSRCGSLQYRAP